MNRPSGCVSKSTYNALQARRKQDTAVYIQSKNGLYEYRNDTTIFRHEATKKVRVKKAEWLAIKAEHEQGDAK
jgi:hypothetical protein